ncbi:ankyrin repeat domain-containing protein [Leptospira sp. 'Mane']|uniref:ankyrin repeat domain-containing protein n=1 Tax=Leptospira sp. 'Mane' TaxID=3387407 RepID=UPI00398BA4E1
MSLSNILDSLISIPRILLFCFLLLGLQNCLEDENVKRPGPSLEARFFHAIHDSNLDRVEACLKEGINIDQKNSLGNSAIILASDQEDKTLVQFLIGKGANVNLRNIAGETAVFRSVFRGNLEILKILIAAGAEHKIKNVEGHSAIDLAEDRGEEKILLYLRKL